MRSAFGPNGENLEGDGYQGDITRGDFRKVFATDGGDGKKFSFDYDKLHKLLAPATTQDKPAAPAPGQTTAAKTEGASTDKPADKKSDDSRSGRHYWRQ